MNLILYWNDLDRYYMYAVNMRSVSVKVEELVSVVRVGFYGDWSYDRCLSDV